MAEGEHIELNPAQKQVVEQGLLCTGFSAVLQMPTGSGKTFLAEQAIAQALDAGSRAIYVTPLRALAEELLLRWQPRFGPENVGVFTGDYGKGRAFPVPFDKARLLIMTPERLDACTRHWRKHWSWIPDVDLLVVDEFHLIGEARRGPRLEGALSRFRRLNPFTQLLALSATLGNRAELASWLGGVHFGSSWRAVPLSWRLTRFRKAADKPALLASEVRSCVLSGGQSLIFVQSRRRAEQLARHLCDEGVATGHHHAGLGSAGRAKTEAAFRRKSIQALVSTGTLEMGLNLPVRQVVLFDLQRFDGADFVPLSVNTVWQRAGRAGRRGLDEFGEVLLMTPSWDKQAERYSSSKFEAAQSRLDQPESLAEQIVAEVGSGLARTHDQLKQAMSHSLAGHQGRLGALDRVVSDMISSNMLVERSDEDEDDAKTFLRPTRLGRIAVRQMLAPSTVASLSRRLEDTCSESYTFLDLLLICIETSDCEPLIPADFEELDELGALLGHERSYLLTGNNNDVERRFACGGRRLLALIKTALVARAWTREGNEEQVASNLGCYQFEIRRLAESLERILSALVAITTPPKPKNEECENDEDKQPMAETPTLRERIAALRAMVDHGIDEEAVTLTYIDGIGGILARRLQAEGLTNIEDLADAYPDDIALIRGVSTQRAKKWGTEAEELVKQRSACCFRETQEPLSPALATWPTSIDPYRLRRAVELKVLRRARGKFLVSGGLEPHMVLGTDENDLKCDCLDAAKGHRCKHVFAVLLKQKNQAITELLARLQTAADEMHSIDLLGLWVGR